MSKDKKPWDNVGMSRYKHPDLSRATLEGAYLEGANMVMTEYAKFLRDQAKKKARGQDIAISILTVLLAVLIVLSMV